jgi:hypothetical protein
MVKLHYKIAGSAKTKAFSDMPPAVNFAVRLVQTYNGKISDLGIKADSGEIVFTHDDIVRVSQQVRLK